MTLRESFVARFGERCAGNIERAALQHDRWIADADAFRWAILVCLDNGCMSVPKFREEHRIDPPWRLIAEWIRQQGAAFPRWARMRTEHVPPLPYDFRGQRRPEAGP